MGKPEVGQILYSLNSGNAARRGTKKGLTKVIVTKVGRKYFTCNKENGTAYTELQYHISNFRQKTEYSADSILYETRQAYSDEQESKSICVIIRDAFEYGSNRKNISLENLRKIYELIN